MGSADEQRQLRADEPQDVNLLSARRRRRIRSMETQFRFLSALVGKQEDAGNGPAEGAAPENATGSRTERAHYGDLRAALWLLRRSRKPRA